jgi:hypothetical protein
MIRTLSTAVLAILAVVLLLLAVRPGGAEAAAPPSARTKPALAVADVVWPAPQEPFDTTPITPVESAGAPMQAADSKD